MEADVEKRGGKTINAKRKGEQGRTAGIEKDRRREAEDRISTEGIGEDWKSRGGLEEVGRTGGGVGEDWRKSKGGLEE